MTHSGDPSIPHNVTMAEVNGGGRDSDHPDHKVVKGVAPIHVRSLCFVDIEHFGWANKHRSVQPIVDIAVVKDKPNGETEYYESKIAVSDLDVKWANEKALEIIGFSSSEWAGAPHMSEVMVHVWAMVAGHAWVGHNASGDISKIEGEFGCSGIAMPRMWACPVYDTSHMARLVVPGLDSYTLESLCEHYRIDPEAEHRAMGGAMRCREVFYKLLGKDKGSPDMGDW